MSDVNLIIMIDTAKKAQIDVIADKLSKTGLIVDKKMATIGMISGRTSEENIDEIRNIEGVANVREEKTISLPPMEDDTPQ